jgi:hypothetical protein
MSGPPPIVAELKVGRGSERSIEPNSERLPYKVHGNFVVNVTTAASYDKDALLLQASLGPYGRGGYEDRSYPVNAQNGPHGYIIESAHIQPRTLDNNQILKVTVRPPASGEEYTYYFQSQKPWAFSGVSSPVLLRVRGNAALFKLDNLAPSIAAGVRRNFSNDTFPFIAFNPILTVWSREDDSEGNGFSLALGGEVDVSGYFQIGTSYQFKEKKAYLIFGLRPEMLYRLTSGTFGSQ